MPTAKDPFAMMVPIELTDRDRQYFEAKFRSEWPLDLYKDKYERYLDSMNAEAFIAFEKCSDLTKANFDKIGRGDLALWMTKLIDLVIKTNKEVNTPGTINYMCYAHIYSGLDIAIIYEAVASNFAKIVQNDIEEDIKNKIRRG